MKARVERVPTQPSDFKSYFRAANNPDFSRTLLKRTGMSVMNSYPSGRAAIQAALRDAGIQPSDEVLIPAYTCYAVQTAVSEIATPVLVDINEEDYNIDTDELTKNITPKTEAIIPIHLFGNLCDLDAIHSIAKENDLVIIEDAAQALGTVMISDEVGSYSDYCVFSLRFTKDITMYKGGLLLSKDELELRADSSEMDVHRIMILASLYASDKLLGILPGEAYDWTMRNILSPVFESTSSTLGPTDPIEISGRMNGFIDSQFQKLESRVEQRRKNAEVYDAKLSDAVNPPSLLDDHSYFRYTIRVTDDREKVLAQLRKSGIGCSKMYSYALSDDEENFPVSNKVAKEIINLPNHSRLGENDIKYIARIVNQIV